MIYIAHNHYNLADLLQYQISQEGGSTGDIYNSVWQQQWQFPLCCHQFVIKNTLSLTLHKDLLSLATTKVDCISNLELSSTIKWRTSAKSLFIRANTMIHFMTINWTLLELKNLELC